MEKITTTTVYLEVPVSERLPEEDGWYSCKYGSDLKDYLWYSTVAKLFFIKGLSTDIVTHWLEKKEEMVCMSKEDLIKTIYDSIAWSANDSLSLSKRPSDKKIQTFINNLFK